MSSSEEANAAIAALNGKEVDGRALKVNEAKPQSNDRGGSAAAAAVAADAAARAAAAAVVTAAAAIAGSFQYSEADRINSVGFVFSASN